MLLKMTKIFLLMFQKYLNKYKIFNSYFVKPQELILLSQPYRFKKICVAIEDQIHKTRY
jgi:hypothetical protein